MKKRIVVFEEIGKGSRAIVDAYLQRGFSVHYYRINGPCKYTEWVRRRIADNTLLPIDEKHHVLTSAVGFHPDLAYDNIDKAFNAFMADDSIAKEMAVFYRDDRVIEVFKKVFLGCLQRFYYIDFTLHQLNRLFPDMEVYFIPTLERGAYRPDVLSVHEYSALREIVSKSGAFCYPHTTVRIPTWFALVSGAHYLSRRAWSRCEIAGFILWAGALSALSLFKIRRRTRAQYRFGIMIISPERQFANKVQKVDFLLDEKHVRKEETVFISWKKLSKQHRRYMTENGLNIMDNLISDLSAKTCLAVLAKALGLLAASFRRGMRLSSLQSAKLLLVYYAIWTSFTDRCRIDNLISYCDFGSQSIARNIILSKTGTKTWYYTDAFNFNNLFISDDNADNVPSYSSIIGLLNYDYFVSWSEELIRYFKLHKQRIGNYVDVGCLWASHISEIRNGKIRSELPDALRKRGFTENNKLVSVFDSTYVDYTMTPYADGIRFLEDVYRLLEELPDIFVVYKEKKSRAYLQRYSPEMIKLLEKLEKHPRCYLPSRSMNSSEAIAFSDLTVSFPFTSTTFEALSARKKALYYDASGKFKGTFYDNIPGLVCHDYITLRNKVNDLLFNISDEEYNIYLDQNIKGKLENYLDEKAISRFRALLTNNAGVRFIKQ